MTNGMIALAFAVFALGTSPVADPSAPLPKETASSGPAARDGRPMASRREIELYVQDMKRWSERMRICREGLQAACDAVPQGMPKPPVGVCGMTPSMSQPTPVVLTGDVVSDQRLH